MPVGLAAPRWSPVGPVVAPGCWMPPWGGAPMYRVLLDVTLRLFPTALARSSSDPAEIP